MTDWSHGSKPHVRHVRPPVSSSLGKRGRSRSLTISQCRAWGSNPQDAFASADFK